MEFLSGYNGKRLEITFNRKKLLVVDFLGDSKRVSINKEREIRKTKAGGFAQGKYQKFVKEQKSDKATEMWIMENLKKPGVLKSTYDVVEINTNEEIIASKVVDEIKKISRVNSLIANISSDANPELI